MLPSRYLRTLSAVGDSVCLSFRAQSSNRLPILARSFSSTTRREADFLSGFPSSRSQTSYADMLSGTPVVAPGGATATRPISEEPYHLHIFCHKHNTHLTLTNPKRDVVLSVSAGKIGFKKAGRGTYDAAFQLAAWTLSQIQERGLLPQITALELIFRGFGEGREGVKKVLMGPEGQNIRKRVTKVTDATRLKFGGTRSPNPRRLG